MARQFFRLLQYNLEDLLNCPAYERSFDSEASEWASKFYKAHGVLDSEKLLDCLSSRRQFEHPFWKAYYDNSVGSSIDVFRIEYIRKDFSKPALRLFVFFLLVAGIATVLVPTAVTTILVCVSIL